MLQHLFRLERIRLLDAVGQLIPLGMFIREGSIVLISLT